MGYKNQSIESRKARLESSREQFALKSMTNQQGAVVLVKRVQVLDCLKKGWTLNYSQVNIFHPTLCLDKNLKPSDYHKMIQLKRITHKRPVEYRLSILIQYRENGWVLGTPPAFPADNTTTESTHVLKNDNRNKESILFFKDTRVECRVICI